MKKFVMFDMLIMLTVLFACVSQTTRKDAASPDAGTGRGIATDLAGKVLQIQVASENIRQHPNGKIIGKLRKGKKITVVHRVGNWIEFNGGKFKNAYIWAPSVGYDYINLYSPYFYFDTTRDEFRPVEFFRKIFSQEGERRPVLKNTYELFFQDIGLGSHEAIVLDVVTETQQVVQHGISLFIDKQSNKIQKVRVDYFRPVRGYQKALQKSDLPLKKPTEDTSGHLIWEAGSLLKGLTVDLERQEWDSKWLSNIGYALPEKK